MTRRGLMRQRYQHVRHGMRISSLSLRNFVILIAVVFLLLINGYTLRQVYADYHRQLAFAEAEAESTTRILEEMTQRVLQTSDLLLTVLAQRILNIDQAFAPGNPLTNVALASNQGLTPFTQNIILLDAEGMYVNTSVGSVPPDTSFADRDYFRVHRFGVVAFQQGDRHGLYVAEPTQARVDDNWFLALSRGVYSASGEFLGVLASIVTAEGIRSFYGDFIADWPGEVVLWHGSGRAVMSSSGDERTRILEDATLDEALEPESAWTIRTGDANGRQRIRSYRSIEAHPLMVMADLDYAVALEPWRERNREQWFFSFLRSIAVMLGGVMLYKLLTLQQRSQERSALVQGELRATQHLQHVLLPSHDELAAIDELDIAGSMQSVGAVGGDYYDVLPHSQGVRMGIGDVTGHGLESGIIMLMTQTIVRALLEANIHDPKTQLDILNRTLYHNIRRMGSDKSLTLSLLNYQQGQLRISGQHESVLLLRASGEAEYLDTLDLGFYLGLELDIRKFVAEKVLTLQPGDGIVLYTDGVTEAENTAGQWYGQERLLEVASQHWSTSAETIRAQVLADVQRYIGQQVLDDDITLVVCKRRY